MTLKMDFWSFYSIGNKQALSFWVPIIWRNISWCICMIFAGAVQWWLGLEPLILVFFCVSKHHKNYRGINLCLFRINDSSITLPVKSFLHDFRTGLHNPLSLFRVIIRSNPLLPLLSSFSFFFIVLLLLLCSFLFVFLLLLSSFLCVFLLT